MPCHEPYLLKMVAEFDDGTRPKEALLVQDQRSVLEGVNVALNEQKI